MPVLLVLVTLNVIILSIAFCRKWRVRAAVDDRYRELGITVRSAKRAWLALSLSSSHASDPPLAAAAGESARWEHVRAASPLPAARGALLLAACVAEPGSRDANESGG